MCVYLNCRRLDFTWALMNFCFVPGSKVSRVNWYPNHSVHLITACVSNVTINEEPILMVNSITTLLVEFVAGSLHKTLVKIECKCATV